MSDNKVRDEPTEEQFTEEDLDNCWTYYKSYLLDILNGVYDLDEARSDLRGLVGSEYDKRHILTVRQ